MGEEGARLFIQTNSFNKTIKITCMQEFIKKQIYFILKTSGWSLIKKHIMFIFTLKRKIFFKNNFLYLHRFIKILNRALCIYILFY